MVFDWEGLGKKGTDVFFFKEGLPLLARYFIVDNQKRKIFYGPKPNKCKSDERTIPFDFIEVIYVSPKVRYLNSWQRADRKTDAETEFQIHIVDNHFKVFPYYSFNLSSLMVLIFNTGKQK